MHESIEEHEGGSTMGSEQRVSQPGRLGRSFETIIILFRTLVPMHILFMTIGCFHCTCNF